MRALAIQTIIERLRVMRPTRREAVDAVLAVSDLPYESDFPCAALGHASCDEINHIVDAVCGPLIAHTA